MADTTSTYFSRFIADMDGFLAPMKEAEKQSNQFEKALKPLTNTAADVGKAMIGVGAAISALGVPFALMSKSAIDNADALYKMSQRTGATVETLSALAVAAELADVQMDEVEKAFKQSARAFEDAATGGEAAQKTLAKLGLNVQMLADMTPDQRFFAIAKSLAAIEDPGLKAGVAMEIFGKAGTAIFPMLEDLAKGQAAVTEQARKFNQIITTEGAKSAQDFNDSLTNLSNAFTGIFNVIANSGILDYLTRFINYIAETTAELVKNHPWITSVGLALGALAAVIGPLLVAAGGLAIGLSALVPVLSGLAAGIVAVGPEVIALGAGILTVVAAVGTAVTALVSFVSTNENLRSAITKAWNDISQAFSNAVDAFMPQLLKTIDVLDELWQRVLPATTRGFDYAIDVIAKMIENVGTLVATVLDGFALIFNTTNKIASAFGFAGESSGELTAEAKNQSPVVDRLTASHLNLFAALGKQVPLMDQAVALWKKAKEEGDKFRAGVDAIVESVVGNTTKTAQLTQALKNLEAAGVPATAIARALSGELLAQKERAEALHTTLPPVINDYANLADSMKNLHGQMQALIDIGKTAKDINDEHFVSLNNQMILLEAVGKGIIDDYNLRIDASNRAMLTEMGNTAIQMQGLIDIAKGSQESYKIQADADQAVADLVKKNAADRAKAHEDAAKTMQISMATALGNVTSDLAKGLADSLLHWENWGRNLKSLVDNLASSLLQSFLTGLFNPLTSQLQKLGAQFANILINAGKVGATSGGGGGTGTGGGGGTGGSAKQAASVFGSTAFAAAAPFLVGGLAAYLAIKDNQKSDVASLWTPVQDAFDSIQNKTLEDYQAYLQAIYEWSQQEGSGFQVSAQQALDTFTKFYGNPKDFGVDIAIPDPWNPMIMSGPAHPGHFNTVPMVGNNTGGPATSGTSSGSLADNEAYRKILNLDPETYRRVIANMPQYAEGGYVERTGPAIVHEGEYVTPANRANAMQVALTLVLPNVRGAKDFIRDLQYNTDGLKTALRTALA